MDYPLKKDKTHLYESFFGAPWTNALGVIGGWMGGSYPDLPVTKPSRVLTYESVFMPTKLIPTPDFDGWCEPAAQTTPWTEYGGRD